MRELTPIDTAHAEHPIFTPDYGVAVIEKCCSELMPCNEGGFESALLHADSELTIEQVAMAQAILGRYEDALSTSKKLKERKPDGIYLVLSIELYRHNRIEEAQVMQRRLDDGKLTDWFGVFLALGMCNRVPWWGYPFPDY